MNRFPRTIFIKQNTIQEQMAKITDELKEVYDEFLDTPVDYRKVAVELLDLIQAAETGLEILREQKGVDIARAEKDMIIKNEKRGYYEQGESRT